MRRGIPMAGNFLQQENVVLTGACEAIVVDVQCIFPALGPLSKCFHTKFVTTSPIAQMPDAEFIRFRPENCSRECKGNRKDGHRELQEQKTGAGTYSEHMKQKATVGYSLRGNCKAAGCRSKLSGR